MLENILLVYVGKYCNFCTNCTDYLGLFNNNTNIEIKRLLKSTTISDFGSKYISSFSDLINSVIHEQLNQYLIRC